MRTQVGIIGAGPAGLLLSHLLHLQGIESVVLESRSYDYITTRIRAGLMEQNTVDLLNEVGLAKNLNKVALPHDGVQFTFDGVLRRINMQELIGRRVTIYGQQLIVKDMADIRERAGGEILYEAEATQISNLEGKPSITFTHNGQERILECDFLAGCDGFHGLSRPSIPKNLRKDFDRIYPFGWLGLLIAAAPPSEELVYCHSPTGFALFSMRSEEVTRAYLQVRPDDSLENWSEDRIWSELRGRLGQHDSLRLVEGEILQKVITPMRSWVSEPMQFGNLYLAGDSAHIVPPTGAKGMNLAIADVCVLSRGLIDFYQNKNWDYLNSYSETCLRRVWRAEHFSWWMTTMLHRFYDANPFDHKRQIAELYTVFDSDAGSRLVAENYAGLPLEPWHP
ncbi:MAG: 4-hydroxybenzoate 3-monooxygenase [Alphaproteobacteria bacterium]